MTIDMERYGWIECWIVAGKYVTAFSRNALNSFPSLALRPSEGKKDWRLSKLVSQFEPAVASCLGGTHWKEGVDVRRIIGQS